MQRRIRLVQITPALGFGGIENRTARLLGGLSRERFALAWAGFGDANPDLFRLAGEDVEAWPMPPHAPGADLGAVRALARRFAAWRPDIVHVHNWSVSLYGILAARLARVPVVLYGLGGRDGPRSRSWKRRAATRAFAHGIDGFTTVCRFLADEIAAEWRVPSRRVTVVPTGVDLARFDGLDGGAARARLGIPPEAVVFGISGILRPVKRLEDFLAAAERLAPRSPEARFVLMGFEGAEGHPAVRAQPERVLPLGRVTRVEEVYAALDVLVSTSAFEGASNAILEAQASGRPVIATRVGGTPELVTDEVEGLLFEVGDVGALTAEMERLAADPALRARLGAAGRRRAAREHDLADMIDRYAALYERAAGTTRRSGIREAAQGAWTPRSE